MGPRFRKDLRFIAPIVLLACAAGCFPFKFFVIILGIATLAVGVLLFSQEYTHQHINWLLAQPLCRTRIWREKLMVLFLAMPVMLIGGTIVGCSFQAISMRFDSSTSVGVAWFVVPSSPVPSNYPYIAQLDLKIAGLDGYASIPLADLQRASQRLYGNTKGWLLASLAVSVRAWARNSICVQSDGAGHLLSYYFSNLILSILYLGLFTLLAMWIAGLGALWMGILLKQFFTALGASAVIPVILVLLWIWVSNSFGFGQAQADEHPFLYGLFWATPALFWGAIALIGSRISIRRLEV